MSRFNILSFRRKDKDKLMGYFNFVDTQTGLEFRDFRLINGAEGVFAAGPFRTYEGADNKQKFSDYVRIAYDTEAKQRDEVGNAFFEELAEAAHNQYQNTEADAPAPRKGAAPAKSARGPVRKDTSDLPF